MLYIYNILCLTMCHLHLDAPPQKKTSDGNHFCYMIAKVPRTKEIYITFPLIIKYKQLTLTPFYRHNLIFVVIGILIFYAQITKNS